MANYYITEGEEEKIYTVKTRSEGVYEVIDPDGNTFTVDAFSPIKGRLNLLVDDRSLDFDIRESEEGTRLVQRRGIRTNIDVLNDRQRRMKVAGVGTSRAQGPDLKSPMAGKVVAIQCALGDTAEEGKVLIVVEAMKMENDLKAHINGKVIAIPVAVGDAVEVGDVLITLEAIE